MVLKNLTAHRMRNKMTSIIYSIALGFIIFLIVSYQLQLKSTALQKLAGTGVYLQYHSGNQNSIKNEYFDPIFKRNTDIISQFSYIPPDAKNINEAQINKFSSTDKAKIEKISTNVYGVQPNIFEATLPDFIKPHYTTGSALSLGDQLYTARGSQSAGMGAYVAEKLNVDPADYK